MPRTTVRLSLTPKGEIWARRYRHSSSVARVALQGYDKGWPDHFVTAAINTSNREGEADDD